MRTQSETGLCQQRGLRRAVRNLQDHPEWVEWVSIPDPLVTGCWALDRLLNSLSLSFPVYKMGILILNVQGFVLAKGRSE